MIPILASGTVQEHISVVVSHQFAATCENEDTSLLTHAQTVSSHHAWRGEELVRAKAPRLTERVWGAAKSRGVRCMWCWGCNPHFLPQSQFVIVLD